jgi:predicted house-cleaning noncanonical NTP pyrophosphatase (MazG superfamily)
VPIDTAGASPGDARVSNGRDFVRLAFIPSPIRSNELTEEAITVTAKEPARVTYRKLVRDRIPEIIRADGQVPHVRILPDAAYRKALHVKLREELDEFLVGNEIAELADLVEVAQAIVEDRGLAWTAFETMRANKRDDRGGFRQRLWLEDVVATHAD